MAYDHWTFTTGSVWMVEHGVNVSMPRRAFHASHLPPTPTYGTPHHTNPHPHPHRILLLGLILGLPCRALPGLPYAHYRRLPGDLAAPGIAAHACPFPRGAAL